MSFTKVGNLRNPVRKNQKFGYGYFELNILFRFPRGDIRMCESRAQARIYTFESAQFI